MSACVCRVCPHMCRIEEGRTGFCRARANKGGKIVCISYGKLTSLSLDPIEKKPLRRFRPGSMILSAGSFGCNLRCPFCQNHTISMSGEKDAEFLYTAPKALVSRAAGLKRAGNAGLAFTYNEPFVSYEYMRDCAALAHEAGLCTVAVTNGYVCGGVLEETLPLIDAMNIDLKSFSAGFYSKINGDAETVKHTIEASVKSGCHVEVTTLIVPGENDSKIEMENLSSWLAGVNPGIPLHVTRFFPRYKMSGKAATPVSTVYSLAAAARKNLKYVYEGNC